MHWNLDAVGSKVGKSYEYTEQFSRGAGDVNAVGETTSVELTEKTSDIERVANGVNADDDDRERRAEVGPV